MTINTTVHHDSSTGQAGLPILIATLMLVISMAFIGSGMAGSAQAQGASNAIPSITLASNEPGQLTITWQAPERAPTDYRLMWANTNLGFPSYKNPNEAERANEYPLGDVTTLTLSNLTPGDSYKVKIRSRYYNADRTVRESSGPWTNVITQRVMNHPPAAPTGLAASEVSHDSLTLTWDDPQDANITGYRVMRGPDGNSLSALADTQGDSTSFTDSTVEPGTTYHYGVLALSQDGDGAQSTTSVTTPAEPQETVQNDPPAAPTGLTASNIEHDSLTITWDDPEDDSITGYRVLRGPDANSLSTLENDTESVSTEYEDETVDPETTYSYGVLALSADGNSVQSSSLSATTPAAPSSGEQDAPREAPRKQDPPPRVGARQVSTSTTDVWTATLTPSDFGSGNLGCNNASATNKCSTAAVLSDDDFTYDSTSYSFTTLNLNATSFSLTVDADITAATTNDLTIVVGSTSLAFAEATTPTARTRTWFNPGFSWTAGTDVSIRIIDLAPPSLTSAVVLADGNTIQLAFSEDLQSANLPPAAAFTVTAGGSAVTVTGVAAESTADVLQITVSPLIGQGQTVVVAYEDPTAVDDANAIQDAAGNDTPDFTTGSGSVPAVTNNSALTNEVLASWSLTPAGLAVGDQFRLIFLSSTKRNALSTDIADYNTFVQDRAAAGHAGILAYSGGFGVIGCTAAVDARDNTSTTGTGVPIYWLDGAKVADDYADFYDGSWADEVNDKDESGADAHDTSQSDNYPFTGCQNDGTEEFAGATNPRGLGATNGNVRIGRLNSSGTLQDPIDGNDVAATDATRPMYGLSAVFEVSSSPSTNPNAPAAVSDVAVVPVRRTSDSLTVSWSAPDNTGKPALNGYDVRYGQDEDNWTTVRQNDAASTTLIITGLRPNNYYDVQVRALSAEYSGPWSSNAEGATISPAETVLANHPLVPDDLGPGDSFRLLYITEDTTAATGTGIHAYHTIAFDGVVSIRGPGGLMQYWQEVTFGQIALLSTPGADARLITDTTWTGTDRGVPIYWVNGARVADDYEDFYDGSWADEANPTSGLGQPHSLADPVPWTGTDHDGTELIDGTASRAVGQSTVGVGAPGSTASGAGPLNGDAAFASTQERPLYGLWHVMVVDENLRLVTNFYQPAVGNVGNIRAAVRAQLFTTGPHSSGYGISSIEVEKGSETATFLGTVAIHTTDGDGDPDLADGLHATLSLENTGSSTWTLAAPAGTVLKPSTTYALVFKGDAGTYPDLYTTSADGEDTPADGWSLADTLVYDSGSGWVDNTAGTSLVIEMIGPLADVATDVWTATLTPVDLGSGFIGCDNSTAATAKECSTDTVLSDDDFTYDSTDYSVFALLLSGGNLTLTLDTDITTNTASDLNLVVGTTSFAFASADTAIARVRTWNSTSLSWTAGTDVAVKLTASTATNTPAAGAPAITAPNVFRVPAVLGVDLSGITDTDGVTNIATTATYKWQRFNAAGTTLETDSIGTGSTYTLTDTDATKTLKVMVNFTDDAINSEGPLTSAATSAITAAASCATPTYVGGATQLGPARKVGVEETVAGGLTAYGFLASQGAGSLDNATFTTAGANNHDIVAIYTIGPNVYFTTAAILTAADKSTLVLHVCDQAYAFAPVTNPTSTPADYQFIGSDQNWSDHAERTVYLSQDTAAPTFTSATVTGSILVVTLSEDLGPAASLANSAFAVKKGTSGTAQTLSGTPSISGSTVTLTLATAVTASDTDVKVAYTKPTSGSANKLIDRFGNETATFTDQDVTNNTNATNTAPTVANAIPDQPATANTAFTFAFAANTFNDTDATDTLTYTATKADGTPLPTWLAFAAGIRTFSGNPPAVETISIKVTATDGTASVSDEFDITVSAAPMPLAVTQQEDRPHAFTESDFSNLPGGRVTLTKVIITELPNNGWLARSKSVLLPSGNRQLQSDRIYSSHLPLTFSLEDTRQLRLAFFPEANENGTPYASFKFKVNSSSEEHTMLINITSVNDPAYGQVFITGTTQVGYTLKAFTSSIGDRDGIPRDQLNYQWKRYAADGTTFEANIGANSNTYTLTNSEQGKKIKLEVRFTDNDGTDEGPLTSPAFPYIATQTIGEATLISTLGMAGDSSHSFTTQEQGQVFTTGTNPNGYTVTSVVIISEDHGQDDVALKICEVNSNLHPTATCTDLTAPGLFQPGPLAFTAPSGTTLAGGRTNYMVVFNSPGGQEVLLDAHKSDGYDGNSLAGFSIRNRIHYKTGSGWQELSYRQGIRMAVLGTINP